VPSSNLIGPGLKQSDSFDASWMLPVLIAAIDPAAEAKLDGLSHAVISGRYLTEHAGDESRSSGAITFPVLAASTSGMDEYAQTQLQLLTPPAAPPVESGP
jgi:putative ABC transport system permease protein